MSLPPSTVGLQFTSDYGSSLSSDIRLFEVEEAVVTAAVAGEVSLKGSPDDEVVLTTAKSTYAVRMLETTNVLLLAPVAAWSGALPVRIPFSATATLEVVRTAPRLSALRSLIALRPYRGRAVDTRSGVGNNDLFTLQELLARVQASEGEIRAALAEMAAVQVDGRWRLVDPPAALETLRVILATMAENGWPVSKVSSSSLITELAEQQIDRELLLHVLSTHGTVVRLLFRIMLTSLEVEGSNGDIYSLNPKSVVTSLGVHILSSSNRRQRVADFLEAWRQQSEDYNVQPNLEMLRGRAISDGNGNEALVWYFPLEALPGTMKERLAALFAAKTKWTAEDIRPYVLDFLEMSVPLESFLAKNTRPISSASGAKFYAAREG